MQQPGCFETELEQVGKSLETMDRGSLTQQMWPSGPCGLYVSTCTCLYRTSYLSRAGAQQPPWNPVATCPGRGPFLSPSGASPIPSLPSLAPGIRVMLSPHLAPISYHPCEPTGATGKVSGTLWTQSHRTGLGQLPWKGRRRPMQRQECGKARGNPHPAALQAGLTWALGEPCFRAGRGIDWVNGSGCVSMQRRLSQAALGSSICHQKRHCRKKAKVEKTNVKSAWKMELKDLCLGAGEFGNECSHACDRAVSRCAACGSCRIPLYA